MHLIEKTLKQIRHHPAAARLTGLWNLVRPVYLAGLSLFAGRNGLERVINGTDPIRVTPELQGVSEVYEPALWSHLMANLRNGDIVVEVGAYVGLFSVAMARRVAPLGQVHAIEPNPDNYRKLENMVAVNQATSRVRTALLALGKERGSAWFEPRASESRVSDTASATAIRVEIDTLDGYLGDRRIDILKIDVEGLEEEVLLGATRLLQDHVRGPRTIYVEVHPFAWRSVESTSRALLQLLRESGYAVGRLDGPMEEPISKYGHIVAAR